MNIKIDKKDGKIHVIVALPHYEKTGIRQKINLGKIIKILDERKIKYGECLQSPKISNKTEESRKGVYIFKIPVAAVKPKRPRTSTVPRVSKETKKQKIVDKS